MNLDAMDMDLDLLDDFELDEVEFDTPFDQNIHEDASNNIKDSSKISSSSEVRAKRTPMSKNEVKELKRKLGNEDGQHDETSLVRKKPKRSSKKAKRHEDSDFVNRKKGDPRNKFTPQEAIGTKNDRRMQDQLSKEADDGIPTLLNVLKQNTAQRKVSRELSISKPSFLVSKNSKGIKNIMPPAQAALFESLSKASNQAPGSLNEPAQALRYQHQYMAHYFAQQRNTKHSLMQKMPITLPFAVDEFFPLAQTHVKDNEPLNRLFPSIFKILSKSSARYNPKLPSLQHPLVNLVYNKIGTKIELIPKGDIALNSKPQQVHLGIDNESIHAGIDCIRTMNRKILTTDLNRLLDKVNRQKNFLIKQMNQISRWYKTFVEDKDSANYSSLDRKRIHSSIALSLGVSKDLINSFIETHDSKDLLISVKVKCNGLKAPRASNIDAIIHPSRELHPALRAIGMPIYVPEPPKANQKLRHIDQKANTKMHNPQPPLDKSVTISNMKEVYKENPVTEMIFADRRVMFKKILADHISQFVAESKTINEKAVHILQKRNKDIQDLLEKNGDEYMDSLTYFNLIKLMFGWDDYTKEEVALRLSTLYQPELPQREIFWGQLPTPIINTQDEMENKNDPTAGLKQKSLSQQQTFSSSLFNRLQSLLAEEDIPFEESTDIDDCSTLPDGIVDEIEELQNADDHSDSALLDVSSLSLDQRTYIQLRAAHLIDQPLLYSCEPQVKEIDGNIPKPPLDIDASINVAIRRKQKQLSDINTVNNGKLEILKELALAEISEN
jgi:hypothetical protein